MSKQLQPFIERGVFCDPSTHTPLSSSDLRYVDSRLVLLARVQEMESYLNASQNLHLEQNNEGEFGGAAIRCLRRVFRICGFIPGFRSLDSWETESRFFSEVKKDSLCVSIGGGPKRVHPQFLNLNIGNYQNIDLIADAHALPFVDGCIDFIHIDAVLEHLSDPALAVREMARVLKPGGQIFAVTPFLQAYHGYPYHFQNFTLTGHELLFKKAGLIVQKSGIDLGPMNALVLQVQMMLPTLVPGMIGRLLSKVVWAVGLLLRVWDPLICRRRTFFPVASTTYVWSKRSDPV